MHFILHLQQRVCMCMYSNMVQVAMYMVKINTYLDKKKLHHQVEPLRYT